MKKLICAADVQEAKKQGLKTIAIEEGTIITPSAQDDAQACGIEFVLGGCASKACSIPSAEVASACSNTGLSADNIYSVLKVLMDKGMLDQNILNAGVDAKFLEEKDATGLKVVRGKSVKMDEFDTGNPQAKVCYQEVVSKDESKISAGFLDISESKFDWKLTYEEIDYVISGTLTVTINGNSYTAKAGDVVFVPSGSDVVWASPDDAHIFYCTYPANWADLL